MKYYFQPDLKVMRSDFQKRLDSFVVFFVPVLLDCTHGSEPFMCMKIAAEQNTLSWCSRRNTSAHRCGDEHQRRNSDSNGKQITGQILSTIASVGYMIQQYTFYTTCSQISPSTFIGFVSFLILP